MMPKFFVDRKDVYTQTVEVDAKDHVEAARMVSDGGGKPVGEPVCEYSLDSEVWTIRDEKGDIFNL